MGKVNTIGLDIAKSAFQVRGVDVDAIGESLHASAAASSGTAFRVGQPESR
jgi:hypothetical protein